MQALYHALPYYFCPAIILYGYMPKVSSWWPQAEREGTVQLQLSLDLSISEKKDLKPAIPKKGIFLEYGCIDNCDIKAEPWSFHLCLCFSRSHRVSVEAKSW